MKYRYGNLSKHIQLTQQSPKLDLKPRFPADKTGILSPLPEAQRQQPRQRDFSHAPKALMGSEAARASCRVPSLALLARKERRANRLLHNSSKIHNFERLILTSQTPPSVEYANRGCLFISGAADLAHTCKISRFYFRYYYYYYRYVFTCVWWWVCGVLIGY